MSKPTYKKEPLKWFSLKNEMSMAMPEIEVIGYIGKYEEVNYEDIRICVRDLKAKGVTQVLVIINSGGGNMVEGFSVLDCFNQSGIECFVHIIGMAASMGGVLTLVAKRENVSISKNAMFMTHKAKGGAWGEADTLRGAAEGMDKMEMNAIQAFVKHTGQSEAIVKEWFKPGVDKWFNAQECLDLGIAGKIIEPVLDIPEQSIKKFANQQEAWGVYNTLNNFPTNMNRFQKLIIAMFSNLNITNSLSETDSEDRFVTHIENTIKAKDARIKELTDAANQVKVNAVNAAVAAAKLDGRINEAEVANWTAMLTNDFDNSNAILTKLPKRQDVNNMLNRDKVKADDPNNPRAKWTFSDWTKKAPKDLQAMKVNEFEKFAMLYKAEYQEDFEEIV